MPATDLSPEAPLPKKRRRWLRWTVAAVIAALAGVFLFYLWITAPVMSREEMQVHFDAARKYLTSASPERLALGERYMDILAGIADVAGDIDAERLEAEELATSREEWIAAGREHLAKLRTLAAEGPGAVAHKNLMEEEADPASLAHVSDGVKLLRVDLIQGAAARDFARVRDDVRAALAVAETVEHRGGFVPRLLGAAARRGVCEQIVQLRASLDEASIRGVSEALARAEERIEPLQDSVWGEIDLIRSVLKQSAPDGVPALINRAAVKGAGLLVQSQLELMAVAAKPPHEAMAEMNQWEKRLMQEEGRLIKWPWIRQRLMFLPAQFVVYRRLVEDRTALRGTRIALALEQCARKKGKYPEKLGLLVPEYIQTLPRDPFSDKEFRYARQGELYLLYSVGQNLEDDGGVANARYATEEEAVIPQVLERGSDFVIFGLPAEEK